jgi:hypothetical protein
MPVVNVYELEEAYLNWCSYHKQAYDDRGLSFNTGFSAFAGITPDDPVTWTGTRGRTVMVSDRAAHCIALLTSPHWQTLLKAWHAKNEESNP